MAVLRFLGSLAVALLILLAVDVFDVRITRADKPAQPFNLKAVCLINGVPQIYGAQGNTGSGFNLVVSVAYLNISGDVVTTDGKMLIRHAYSASGCEHDQ